MARDPGQGPLARETWNERGYSGATSSDPEKLAPKTAAEPPFNSTLITLSYETLKVIWMDPLNNGGATIKSYVVEWDSSPSFANSDKNGWKVNVPATSTGANDFTCVNINLDASLKGTNVYARIFSDNGFKLSLEIIIFRDESS